MEFVTKVSDKMAKGKLNLKQEVVVKLLENVQETQMGELLRQKAGLKNSLRGKPANELLSRTLTFVLDCLVEKEKEAMKKDEDEETSETDEGSRKDEKQEEDAGQPPHTDLGASMSNRPIDTITQEGQDGGYGDAGGPSIEARAEEWQQKKKPICRYWKKGKCRKKNDCVYSHPPVCVQFMKNGQSRYRQNGKGCDGKCELTHPMLCRGSMKRGVCNVDGCRFTHTKDTKILPRKQQKVHPATMGRSWADAVATKPVQGKPMKSEKSTGSQSSEQQPFLSIHHLQLQHLIREVFRREVGAMFSGQDQNKQVTPQDLVSNGTPARPYWIQVGQTGGV